MRHRLIRCAATMAVATLTILMSGCTERLPAGAKEAALGAFDFDQEPSIDYAKQVELLPEDVAANAEEVWCVSIVYTCWSCDYQELRKCGDNRLLRFVDGDWETVLVASEQDKEAYKARGCRLLDDFAGQ